MRSLLRRASRPAALAPHSWALNAVPAAMRSQTSKPVILLRTSVPHRLSSSGIPNIDDGAGQHSLFCLGTPGFGGPHDLGGVDELMGQVLDTAEAPLRHWEQDTHALLVALVSSRLLTVRRVMTCAIFLRCYFARRRGSCA